MRVSVSTVSSDEPFVYECRLTTKELEVDTPVRNCIMSITDMYFRELIPQYPQGEASDTYSPGCQGKAIAECAQSSDVNEYVRPAESGLLKWELGGIPAAT